MKKCINNIFVNNKYSNYNNYGTIITVVGLI